MTPPCARAPAKAGALCLRFSLPSPAQPISDGAFCIMRKDWRASQAPKANAHGIKYCPGRSLTMNALTMAAEQVLDTRAPSYSDDNERWQAVRQRIVPPMAASFSVRTTGVYAGRLPGAPAHRENVRFPWPSRRRRPASPCKRCRPAAAKSPPALRIRRPRLDGNGETRRAGLPPSVRCSRR